MRWLYHLLPRSALPGGCDYAPASLAREGFIHCSYRDAVAESARLYFAPGADVVVLQIDPRALDVPVREASTPRGPMPHVHGAIAASAIVGVIERGDVDAAPDRLEPT